MPPTPTEQERAWQLVTALVSNDKIGPPRNTENDADWEKIYYRALQLSVLFTATVAGFP